MREKTKYRTTVSDLKNPNGHIIRRDLEKADLFKYMFVSAFVSEPPGKLPVFDVRFQGAPVTSLKIVSEYDQEIPQSQTADNPMAP